jgi:hypothetical protein
VWHTGAGFPGLGWLIALTHVTHNNLDAYDDAGFGNQSCMVADVFGNPIFRPKFDSCWKQNQTHINTHSTYELKTRLQYLSWFLARSP